MHSVEMFVVSFCVCEWIGQMFHEICIQLSGAITTRIHVQDIYIAVEL